MMEATQLSNRPKINQMLSYTPKRQINNINRPREMHSEEHPRRPSKRTVDLIGGQLKFRDRTQTEMNSRILTAGAKKRFPKDFFDLLQLQKTQDSVRPRNLRNLKINVRFRTEVDQEEINQQETPKFLNQFMDQQPHIDWLPAGNDQNRIPKRHSDNNAFLPERRPLILFKRVPRPNRLKLKEETIKNCSELILPQLSKR